MIYNTIFEISSRAPGIYATELTGKHGISSYSKESPTNVHISSKISKRLIIDIYIIFFLICLKRNEYCKIWEDKRVISS